MFFELYSIWIFIENALGRNFDEKIVQNSSI